MNNLDFFFELPLTVQVAAVVCVLCATTLLVMILAAPRRDCFFLRWGPVRRFLALFFAPVLLIIWPILLYGWFLESCGVDPDDLDWDD